MPNRFRLAAIIDGWIRPGSRRAQEILRFGEKATASELKAFRDRAFADLARYAYEAVPYYRRVMDERGIAPSSVTTVEDVRRFPVLTKDIVRREGENLRSRHLARMKWIVRRSGGTTGEPIASYVDSFATALETYSFFRGLQWMGWVPGERRVVFAGGSLGTARKKTLRDRLRNWASGVVELPAFELGPESFDRYRTRIESAGSCVLMGYTSVLRYFAELSEASGRPPRNVKLVLSTAEQLGPDQAVFISGVFGAPAKSFYGCGEVNSLGYQIDSGGEYLVPDEHVILEAATEGAEVEAGSLLVTTLFNHAQPLIRYAMGDAGVVVEGGPGAKRSRITELSGRTSDMFLRRDGSKLSGSFAPHLVFVTGMRVRRYQLIQHTLADIEFRYEPVGDDVAPAEKEEVLRIVREHMDDDVEIRYVKTGEFVRSPLGKHRIMICELSRGK